MRTVNASVVWDAHSCLPIEAGIDFDVLERHRRAGFDFVSINIAMDMTPLPSVLRAIAWFRDRIASSPDKYVLAEHIDDVEAARATGRLAVAFDIEGAACLLGRPEMVDLYARLGVRMMHLAYNLNNAYSAGCHGEDTGLTPLGAEVVRAANRAGIVMDCSHTSLRASLQIMELSERPVVFSHSNVAALAPGRRNIVDEQIAACARTGGVIGICAYARFLGAVPGTADQMVRHIDHIAQTVGVDHVGLGWDYSYPDEGVPLAASEEEFRRWFPDAAAGRDAADTPESLQVPLEHRPLIGEGLSRLGYPQAAIDKVMGLNFARVAAACWPAR